MKPHATQDQGQATPEVSHTPGPWQADECEDANGFTTIREGDGTPNGALHTDPIATVYRDANARLIAAAPDLLEACKSLLYATEHIDHIKPQLNKASEAIAKAEGKQ